jgi:F-type H+-transporting ATPase subunit alpha
MPSYQGYKNQYQQSLVDVGETGYVTVVTPPIVRATGLPSVKYGEVVYFETGEMGVVTSMSEEFCEILLFARDAVSVGTQVSRSGEALQVPVGDEYLGKTIDPMGRSTLTDMYIPKPKEFRLIERSAPGIDKREKIAAPFETGVTVVDMMVPLGKGQRELVLGDRQTGKTEFLLQTLLTQAQQGMLCIYANIGKKRSDIRRVEKFSKDNNILNNVIIMSSSSTDPLGMIYITPYSAMTLAEYFVEKGRDVLLILDDLSTHAKFYREIALTGKRFPGRNSYPGDIFYSHSRLLERAGNFVTNNGSHSITCLAVAETIESDISGYIQTNLMSITDGHLYFDHELFEQGRRPAVNYFLSVTRVGRQTQNKIRWGINRELSSFLTLYEKTQRFIHFGAEVNEGIKATLNMGSRLLSFFDQPMGTSIDQRLQIVLFCLIWVGSITFESSTKIKYLRDKSHDLYINNKDFKAIVDTLLSESTDFNVLLGKISQKSKELVKFLDLEKAV